MFRLLSRSVARGIAGTGERWLTAEAGRFQPWLSVFLIAGAVLYFRLRAEPPAWIGVAALAASVLACLSARRRLFARGAALCALAAAAGFLSGQFATWRTPPFDVLPRHALALSGTVRQVDPLPGGGRRIRLRAARLAPDAPVLARDVRVRLRGDDPTPVASGDVVAVRALLRPPAPPAYPGGWDLQRDAFFGNLSGSGFAIGPASVVAPAPAGPMGWMRALRGRIASGFIAAMPAPEGAIAATLFTGMPTAIPEPDRAAFRDSGLAHLLAVAGLHIGIVMGLGFGVARWLLSRFEWAALHLPCKQLAGAASLALGAAYLVLTGAHVPIVRSFAMASLVVAALLAGRRAVSLRGLAIAAAALVAISPHEVMGVSFQMSFAAVLALIVGHQACRPAMRRLRALRGGRIAAHAAELAITSALAGLASMPFGAYHFNRVQLYFVAANLIAVPVTAMLVMPAGLLACALIAIGLPLTWAAPALAPMRLGIDAILWIGRAVAAWPAAVLPTPPMPGWGLALAGLGIAWLCLWRSRLRWAGAPMLALALASPWTGRPPDLLVSADSRLVALRTPAGIAIERMRGASKFTLQNWREMWGGRVFALPASGEGARYACDPVACRLGISSRPVALLVRGEGEVGCEGVGVAVLSDRARKICRPSRNLGWVATRHGGAVAIWLEPAGPRLLFDRDVRGARPWVLLGRRRRPEP